MNCKIHRYTLTILEHHLDTFGHVNNATYLQILEEARWDFITSRGFGLKEVMEMQKGPIVLEINMKFLKEIKLRQNIIVESQTISTSRMSAELRQTILSQDHVKMFEAKIIFGFFDLKLRKLISPTEQWLKAIGVGS